MIVTGYKYDTELLAQIAQRECNAYHNIPTNPNNVTKNWIDYQSNQDFFYILYDESILPILGDPIQFEIQDPQGI